jgi:hypothetical protein
MPQRKSLRVVEILIILGVLLAFIIPGLERQAGSDLALFASRVKVAVFVVMAILVPTLLLREHLRRRRKRRTPRG